MSATCPASAALSATNIPERFCQQRPPQEHYIGSVVLGEIHLSQALPPPVVVVFCPIRTAGRGLIAHLPLNRKSPNASSVGAICHFARRGLACALSVKILRQCSLSIFVQVSVAGGASDAGTAEEYTRGRSKIQVKIL